jgi:hypothetical protein
MEQVWTTDPDNLWTWTAKMKQWPPEIKTLLEDKLTTKEKLMYAQRTMVEHLEKLESGSGCLYPGGIGWSTVKRKVASLIAGITFDEKYKQEYPNTAFMVHSNGTLEVYPLRPLRPGELPMVDYTVNPFKQTRIHYAGHNVCGS